MSSAKISDELKWYGRRRGHKLRPNRQALIDNLLPKLKIKLPQAELLNLETFFACPVREIWLEIGFGSGEHLASHARLNPDIGFIGCEPYLNGIARHLSLIQHDKLINVRIFDDDARKLIRVLPDSVIDRVYALYSDPWPKKRHHRRRFISVETVNALTRIMKDGAQLRLASDHMGYVSWMLEHLCRHPELEWQVRSKQDWEEPPLDWIQTRYEEKANDKGLSSAYLCFSRRHRESY